MKHPVVGLSLISLSLFIGCAGPIGPPLGLGPAGDDLVIVALLGLLAALAYRPICKGLLTHREATNAASPLDIVRERYARGEIDQDEYERMKQHLQ